jgi:hypothetical protein
MAIKPLLFLLIIPLFLMPLAYATNESSYKFGYTTAGEISKCTATQVLTNNGDDCNRGEPSLYWVCGTGGPYSDQASDNGAITNKTACNDDEVSLQEQGPICMLIAPAD